MGVGFFDGGFGGGRGIEAGGGLRRWLVLGCFAWWCHLVKMMMMLRHCSMRRDQSEFVADPEVLGRWLNHGFVHLDSSGCELLDLVRGRALLRRWNCGLGG